MNKPTIVTALLAAASATFGLWLVLAKESPRILPRHPSVDLTTCNGTELRDRLREAMSQGISVRVAADPGEPRRVAADGSTADESGRVVEHWSRLPRSDELPRIERLMQRIRQSSDQVWNAHGNGRTQAEAEAHIARNVRDRIMVDAAKAALAEGLGFVTKGPIPQLAEDDEWFFWNVRFHTQPEGDVLLYVPLDLARHPSVRAARHHARDLAEVVEVERAQQLVPRSSTETGPLLLDRPGADGRTVFDDEAARGGKKR